MRSSRALSSVPTRRSSDLDGLIAVSVAVSRAGAVVAGPAIASRGFVYVKENEALLEELGAVVLAALAEGAAEGAFDRETVAARSEEHTSELQSHSDLVCAPLELSPLSLHDALPIWTA